MVNSTSLIESLRTPAAYMHETHGTIECVETHISWVLLAGDFALQDKKTDQEHFPRLFELDPAQTLLR